MGDGATWIAVAMAAIALVGTIVDKITQRKRDHDKAESDRLLARDKLEFDSKLILMEGQLAAATAAHQVSRDARDACEKRTAKVEGELTEVREELAACREQHASANERLAALERAVGADKPVKG